MISTRPPVPLQALTPDQHTIVMNVMTGQETMDESNDTESRSDVEGTKRSEEEQLEQILLHSKDIIMKEKVGKK